MKPLVYLIDKNKDDVVLTDYEQLQEMLNEVYQAGFYDGQNYLLRYNNHTTEQHKYHNIGDLLNGGMYCECNTKITPTPTTTQTVLT